MTRQTPLRDLTNNKQRIDTLASVSWPESKVGDPAKSRGIMIDKLRARLATSGVLLSVTLLPLTSWDVHAYIDPGTGSLVLQVLIASFVGGLFLIKAFFVNLLSRAGRGNG